MMLRNEIIVARMISLQLKLLALLIPYYAYAFDLLNPGPRILIIGGAEAPEGRYPYAVALHDDDGTQYCGGSLIGKDVILTAAHCIALDMSFTVAIGRHNLTSTNVGDDVTIAAKVPHPSYNMRLSEDYDIGLIFLSRPTITDVEVVSINFDSSVPVAGTSVTYLGWGEIDTDPSTVNSSQTLREVESTVITNGQCEKKEGFDDVAKYYDSYNGLITENMLCTHAVDKDSCQKDSGGPLIMRGNNTREDVQVGVASWGISCASDIFPGVTARISAVQNWIKDTVCSKSLEPGLAFQCGSATPPETSSGDAIIIPIDDHLNSPYPNGTTEGKNMTLPSIEMSDLLGIFEGDDTALTEVGNDTSDEHGNIFIEIDVSDLADTSEGGDRTTLPKIDTQLDASSGDDTTFTDIAKGGDSSEVDNVKNPEIEMSEMSNQTDISQWDTARSVDTYSYSRSAEDIILGIVLLTCVIGCLLLRYCGDHRAGSTSPSADPYDRAGSTLRIDDTWAEQGGA